MADSVNKIIYQIEGRKELELLAEALKKHGIAQGEVTDTELRSNKSGKAYRQTITGLTEAGDKFEVVLRKTARSLKLLTFAIESHAKTLAQDTKETIKWTNVEEKARRDVQNKIASAEESRRKKERQWAYEEEKEVRRISKIRANAATNRRLDIAKLENAEEAAVRKISALRAAHAARTVNRADAVGAQQGLLAGVGNLNQASPEQLNRILAIANTASGLVARGKIPAQQLANIFQIVGTNGAHAFHAISVEEQQAVRHAIRFHEAVRQIGQQNPNIHRIGLSFQAVGRIIQVQALHKLIGLTFQAIEQSIQTIADFQLGISRIQTITQEAGLSTGFWSDELTKLSNKFNIPLIETSAAAYSLLSNQIAKGKDATGPLSEAFKFVKITGSSAKEAVDLLSFSLNAFKLKADESHRVASILFKTIDLGNVSAQQLAQGFGAVAPFAKQVGLTIEDLSAALVTLTIQGIDTDTSLTLIKNVVKELISPSKEMKKVFNDWEVASGSAAIAQFGFYGVLQKLEEQLKKGGPELLAQQLNEIRAYTGAIGLFGEGNLKIFKSAKEQFDSAGESFDKAYKIIESTPSEKVRNAWNEFSNIVAAAGNSFFKGSFGIFEETPEIAARKRLIDSAQALFNKTGGQPNAEGLFLLEDKIKKYQEVQKLAQAEHIRIKEFEDAELSSDREKRESARRLGEEKLKIAEDYLKAKLGLDDEEFEKAEKHLNKILEKSREVYTKIQQEFLNRTFEDRISILPDAEKFDAINQRIGELAQHANDLFAFGQLEQARDTFEQIANLAEKTNKEISQGINKSLDKIADINLEIGDRALEGQLRGKGGTAQRGIITGRVSALRAQALNETDIEKQRAIYKDIEKLATKLNTLETNRLSKLKLKPNGELAGDTIIGQNLLDRKAAEEANIKRLEKQKTDEQSINDARLQLETQTQQRIKESLAILNEHEGIIEDIKTKNREDLEFWNKKIEAIKAATKQLADFAAVGGSVANIPAFVSGFLNNAFAAPVSAGGFATGGMLGYATGGTVGRDGIPFMGRAGEMVMNERASKSFYPLFSAMNAGFIGGGSGGGSNVSVGDINISMTSGGNAEADVREIGFKLRRAIKRGTLRLN